MVLWNCPVCGGKLRSETLGWICYACQGFIDMQGVFHEHTEKPFMPPMTNADRIRAMTDEDLADIMSMHTATGACNDWGIPHEKCGGNCRECIIDWLKQPVEVE